MTRSDSIKYRKRKIQKERRRALIIAGMTALFIIFICSSLFNAVFRHKANIKISAQTVSVRQDDTTPYVLKPSVEITREKDKKIVLDKSSNYTVADLISDLEKGSDVVLNTDADITKEGTYTIEVSLSDALQEKLQKTRRWKKRLKVETVSGSFTVENPVGTWDGKKFKRYDGTYVTEDFVVSKGKTYYFDKDGNKVTGRQSINDRTYFFSDKGAMKTGWKKTDEGTYYLGEDGAAVSGWLTLDDAEYYFGEDGLMLTGEQRIGFSDCQFGEDGKLISKKDGQLDPNKPAIALTFDDGPGERTGELLDMLEKYDAHATFFMLGEKVEKYGEFVQRMKDIGCELGNHSYNHPKLTSLSAGEVSNQIGSTNTLISDIVGSPATVMRPPYGAINDTVKSSAGMPLILWSIDTLDWKTRNAQSTIDCVMETAKDGDIVLMHDIHTQSIDAALELIPKLVESGYQLVTVSELAASRDIKLESGQRYAEFKK